MASTEIYVIKKDGALEWFRDVPRASRGAWLLWRNLEEKYLPSLPRPEWMEDGAYASRLSFRGNNLCEIWGIFYDKGTSHEDRILMGSTFDKVYIAYDDLDTVAGIYESTPFRTENLEAQAKAFRDVRSAYQKDDIIGVWKNETSVCCIGDFCEYAEDDGEDHANPLMGKDWASLMDIVEEVETKS
jgi:hypothetical protein